MKGKMSGGEVSCVSMSVKTYELRMESKGRNDMFTTGSKVG